MRVKMSLTFVDGCVVGILFKSVVAFVHGCRFKCDFFCSQFDSNTMKRQRLECPTSCVRVKLNVGGKRFDISQETLVAFGYLHARIVNEQTEADDEIFVDRDPLYFQILLQAIRNFSRPSQKDIVAHKQHLLAECAFYCINDWLTETIIGKISCHHMRLQDQQIRTGEISGDFEIVDPFQVTFERGNASDLGTVLFQSNGDCPGFDCENLEVLKSRLDVLSGGLLRKLHGTQGILIAGGAVVSALQGYNRCSDFDLFLMCSPSEGLSKVRSIYEACRETGSKTNLMVTRTRFSVTIFRALEPTPLPIQVRLSGQLACCFNY